MTKSSIDRLAGMIWYQAVEDGLGLDSPITVELRLEGDRVKPDKDGIKRPRKWRQFSLGLRTPEDIPGNLNVFDIAEHEARGTARWFRSPMWKVLNGKIRSAGDVRKLISALPALNSIVLSVSKPIDVDIPAQGDLASIQGSAPFVRFEAARIDDCINLDGLDLLEAIVLLLEYGHLSCATSIISRALELYRAASPKICKIPALRYTFDLFFEAVEARYASPIDVMPDDIFPPWHVRMPELTQRTYDIDAMRKTALDWDGEHEVKKGKPPRDLDRDW